MSSKILVSLHDRGQTTAFIGSTGSGKSTLINLIPRFYDASEGVVRVDGVDVRDVDQKTLREDIGYIPQKGILLSGTVEENLKYGNQGASDEQVLKALEIAQGNFILDKEEGLQYRIAQGGTNVSEDNADSVLPVL
ncbi:ATP-binding cassette domain-containing protein [Erysipelothrix sp. D19-032]